MLTVCKPWCCKSYYSGNCRRDRNCPCHPKKPAEVPSEAADA